MKKIISRSLLIALLATVVCSQPVFAVGIDYSDNNINWYDPRGNNVCGTSSGASGFNAAKGNDNEQTIFFTLLKNGFTKQQAAAVLGNFQQESGFSPKAIQSNGEGHGIAQWGKPGRWDELVKFAGAQDPYDINVQMAFVIHEITTVPQFKTAFAHFQKATSLADQVSIWANEYEIAGIIGPRLTYAQAAQLEKWYISAPDNSTGGNNGTTGGCAGSAGASQYVNGFIIYNQCDSRWADKPYSTTTVCHSGCGPTSMAMIITNLTGQSVTPDVVAAYAASRGMYIPGKGSSGDIGPVTAQHWGLSSKPLGRDVNAINAALQSGALIVMGGLGPQPFTSGGHVIVIRAVTAGGKWLIGNSDPRQTATNTMEFDPQQIITYAGAGTIHAISK